MQDFEKLGQFYLGKSIDPETGERTDDLLMYDSRDLCTHAVVVGMTGSGKTGLCIDLLEEAALDRIPAIVIDPKGDINNLLLTFPELRAEDFQPWVDAGQASRKGVTVEEFAEQESEKWRTGLAKWGQDGQRIAKLRETVQMRIYTPGSSAGRPLTILKSFAAPDPEIQADPDALRDRISGTTSGLLALLGIEADPINSREHILISKLLEAAWPEGRSLSLPKLIEQIQTPPFNKVGVMDLDQFYPEKDRLQLAMMLNNLLASPSFASWMQGEPLDIKRMLHTPEGKPCISIVSIAHLSDQERMFFVTILLNEMIAWMRSQAGTSSLRALLYMDEVFGYFPPTKNPPSKQPMLTLLKQARAFGLGCVLATQNPVDLDYKGLSNAGTWWLGRLQTERDKLRVLEGLEGAASQAGSRFDRAAMEQTLAGLGSRRFLMNNVHEDQPVVFETRWAMSYLRGPLTRLQLQELVQSDPELRAPQPDVNLAPTHAAARVDVPPQTVPNDEPNPRDQVPSDVDQFFVEPNKVVSQPDRLVYRPALLARGRLHYIRASYNVDQWQDQVYVSSLQGGELPNEVWDQAEAVNERLDFDSAPNRPCEFDSLPDDLQKARNYKTWQKAFLDFVYREKAAIIWKCEDLKEYSLPNEPLGDFKVRLEQKASEIRDAEVEKLRRKYQSKVDDMRDRIRRGQRKVQEQTDQYEQQRLASTVSFGSTLMGALFGRRSSRAISSTARSYSKQAKEKQDIQRAEQDLAELQREYAELQDQFNKDVAELQDKLSVDNLEYVERTLAPRKSDLSVEQFGIAWLPVRVTPSGRVEAIY